MKGVEVLIEYGFLGDKTLTYSCGGRDVPIGVRVLVPLNERSVVGFVTACVDELDLDVNYTIKPIIDILDDVPLFNGELFALGQWLAYRNCVPLITALQAMLPNKVKPASSATPPKIIRMIEAVDYEETQALSKQAHAFLNVLDHQKSMTYSQGNKLYSGVMNLVRKGLVNLYEVEASYQPRIITERNKPLTLTAQQQQVMNSVILDHFQISLLFGSTGSGKTEIYLQSAQRILDQGKQVLILVPEIGLTPQMIQRFEARLGIDVGVYHSGLNNQEKYEQYKRVKSQSIQIVIGTRSTIFLPFQNLGLIVLDEEHDTSYKNGNLPFYHARDVAAYRAQQSNCPLILGSASPSFESYARALRGNYQLLELPGRVHHHFPEVSVVNSREGLLQSKNPILSQLLIEKIQAVLARQQQVILLLNRRGYHTLVKCQECNEIILCPHCDIGLNFHQSDQRYHCHYCGYSSEHAYCHNGHKAAVIGSGIGTQKLEILVKALFPDARVERFDADSTATKHGHEKVLKRFANHDIDLLIGTQMLAKGIDIDKVTLVGILNADATLQREDYRATELTFDLLLQAAGRSGRGQETGEVVIQTFNEDHYAITSAVHHDYKRFFAYEMRYRKMASYPPYTYLISIVFLDKSQSKLEQATGWFSEQFMGDSSIKVLGPTSLRKKQDHYRERIILKGRELDAMIEYVNQIMDVYRQGKSHVKVTVDVNPMGLES